MAPPVHRYIIGATAEDRDIVSSGVTLFAGIILLVELTIFSLLRAEERD